MSDIKWINILSDEYVSFAAFVWEIGKAEAWGRLDRAIKGEEIRNPIPLEEFKEYLQIPISPKKFEASEITSNIPDPIISLHHSMAKASLQAAYQAKQKEKESRQSTYPGFWFFIFILVVHSFIWRNLDVPSDLSIFFLIISIVVSTAIVSGISWIIGLMRKE